jgi:CRP/FNR family cyclic AMP-dependent transcriptional regulator
LAIFSDEPLLSVLAAEDLRALLKLGYPHTFATDERILKQGYASTHVLAILGGWTAVRGEADNGRSVIFGLLGPQDLVGEIAALDGGPRTATVTALTPVEARVISAPEFRDYLERHPRASAAVTRLLTARLRSADFLSQDMATLPVLRRLARLLLDLAGSDRPAEAVARLTQQEMAGAIGASREAVAKNLATLRERGIVRSVDRRVVVADPRALRAIADL